MKNSLTPDQRKELESELRRERGRKLADRIRVILLLDQGKTYASIAEYLFLDEDSIGNYRRRYFKDGGLEALLNDDYKGQTTRLSIDQQMELSLHLESNLYNCIAPIVAYVKHKFKVTYKKSGLTALLLRMGFSYKKPKGVPGKANRQKQEEFIALYNKISTKGKVYFSDATHPMHNPVLGYGWIKRGCEIEVFTNAGRNRVNILGALCLDNLDVVTRSFDTINSLSVCQLLELLRQRNPEEKNLYLILDNAACNRSYKVREEAKKLKIKLIYLPGYSPNLNPIERLWKYFKKNVIYNTYYPELDQFKDAISSFFKGLRGHRRQLATLLTDNFQVVGT